MNYEKTKQIWEEYSNAEKEEIILRIPMNFGTKHGRFERST